MSLKTVKRLAKRITGAGTSRIRIMDAKEAEKALTSDDVRDLIKKKKVVILKKQGVGRVVSNKKQNTGSRKGRKYAGYSRKERWEDKVRALRRYLKNIKPMLKEKEYRKLYYMIKGNAFRDVRFLKTFIENNKLLKTEVKTK
ncbi:50S ribosomal protein L19e [uncultured archaeon]|nr:50S ribosomal protein L19e [uncultured archaeon]